MSEPKQTLPPQHQASEPGHEGEMRPRPLDGMRNYVGSGRLADKVAIVTGGDSGIGKAVAIGYAKEGANVVVVYLNEHEDAAATQQLIAETGVECELIAGDVGDPEFCAQVVARTMERFGKLDILVNNAAEQHPQDDFLAITPEQLERTFRTNIFAMFHLVRAARPHLKSGARIVNTTSVTAYRGSPHLVDYASTKGAIVGFTRSLALAWAKDGIHVNAVAPGPVWTPLIPSTFSAEQVSHFGGSVPLGRPGQPDEIAPAYVFLASADSSYMTGQVIHPNGGEIVNA